MTPKEKAEELVDKFFNWYPEQDAQFIAKQCALIAVDYILRVLPQNEYFEDLGKFGKNRESVYWQDVKQEIEKL